MVYIPAFNVERYILSVLDELPPVIWTFADVVVVDNQSTDGTVARVVDANRAGRFPRQVAIVQPPVNAGYAGSQKLAYKIALANDCVEWVVMLHGDGQYPPGLVRELLRAATGDVRVVYGHRDRSAYPEAEETPFVSYVVIRALSAIESLVTGYPRREWHSGFVAYHRDFLAGVALDELTTTPHIDGHMLFASGVLGARVRGLPIYKRYAGFEAFGGLARVRYVLSVFYLMLQFRWSRDRVRRSGDLVPPVFRVAEPGAEVADAARARRAFDGFVMGGDAVERDVRLLLDRLNLRSGDLATDLQELEDLARQGLALRAHDA